MPAMKKALLALGALAILGGGAYYFFVIAPRRQVEPSLDSGRHQSVAHRRA